MNATHAKNEEQVAEAALQNRITRLEKLCEHQKQTIAELLESEKRHRAVLDNIEEGYFEVDLAGNMVFFNDSLCKITGYPRETLMGMNNRAYTSPETAKRMYKVFNSIYRTGNPVNITDYEIIKCDGCRCFLELSTSLILDAASRPIGFRGVARDVSAQKKLEDRLLHSQKMEAIGTLAGGIAHDFNNLLMGIQGRTSLILMDADTSQRAYEHLKGIEEYVKNAANLTRQLLGFARGGKYEVRPTNLNDLVAKSVHMFGRTRKEIKIETRFQTDVWTVEVDQGQIEQALLNLYVNAWQAMPGGGKLSLETKNVTWGDALTEPYHAKSEKFVMISVKDTGEGIEKDIQTRIFDPFFTTKEVGRGTGLGLSSAYGIIQNHNGVIEVFSKKGEGTTFTIYLPACDNRFVKEKEKMESVLTGNETILLVDDEEMIVEIGKEILNKLGYTALLARSGPEALKIYQENRDAIDLIILDMIMPGMSGKETYEALKALNCRVKILLSSGYSLKDQTTRILENGCDGFIQKPFSIKDLSRKMREILEQKGEHE